MTSKQQEARTRAEATAASALQAEGFTVTNLNELAGNFPAADLVASRGTDRLMIQVRGTTIPAGKFRASPAKARILDRLAPLLGCHAIYSFVHFTTEGPIILFDTAARVTVLAEEDEAATKGTNRFHVNIDRFTIEASHISELLNRGE